MGVKAAGLVLHLEAKAASAYHSPLPASLQTRKSEAQASQAMICGLRPDTSCFPLDFHQGIAWSRPRTVQANSADSDLQRTQSFGACHSAISPKGLVQACSLPDLCNFSVQTNKLVAVGCRSPLSDDYRAAAGPPVPAPHSVAQLSIVTKLTLVSCRLAMANPKIFEFFIAPDPGHNNWYLLQPCKCLTRLSLNAVWMHSAAGTCVYPADSSYLEEEAAQAGAYTSTLSLRSLLKVSQSSLLTPSLVRSLSYWRLGMHMCGGPVPPMHLV